ncbi:alpha/beta-hydrolase [Pleurotus eryngii]|uniref:Alpha/beta-hydrolase n=1 Tax=Pleurotus eryngii TaxID=5323 RepID=A0A9P5ZHE1_PLEER|nr:alpha/beta-hydrolase [Pleurotus eryngii]
MVQFPSNLFLIIAASLFIDVIVAASVVDTPIGTLHRRSYFYIGGELNQLGNVTTESGQLYVERLTPARVTQPLPILFIHGRGMTGTNFLNTPDGRLGWADHFMSRGFEVYIVDQTERGRSSWINGIDGVQDAPDTFTIESRFTATQRFNIWPQASLHTQWPGNGSVGDTTFDNFFASVMPSLVSEAESSERMRVAGSQLLDEIGPVILLTHSQAGQYGWILGDARPSRVKAIVALEPIGPPFQNAIFTSDPARPFGVTEIPLTFSPPISLASDLRPVVVETEANFTCFEQARPARKLSNLAKVPVLVITSQSSYHAVYDECSVHFLQQAGVHVQHVPLESVGIMGNGHMMFLEKNNLQIADKVILNWIQHSVSF